MTHKNAITAARDALSVQIGASEHRKDFGEFYLQAKSALAKLDALIAAIPKEFDPENIDDEFMYTAVKYSKNKGAYFKVAKILHEAIDSVEYIERKTK